LLVIPAARASVKAESEKISGFFCPASPLPRTVAWHRRGSRTGSAQFHFLTSLFGLEVRLHNDPMEDEIRQLRAQGLSVAEIAKQTETTPAVVRRVVGKLDAQAVADRRRVQEATARRIDAEALPWSEKATRWTAETGQSEATFWRVLKRCGEEKSA
jgi:hypothetical protein